MDQTAKLLIIAALCVANIIAFVMMFVDKRRAIKKAYRISERALMTAAACFGALGAFAGMQVFRHKTQHRKFTIGVPLLLFCQVVLLFFLFRAIK